jgi:pimeloyl-ACP methyl ester carboxylesterase
MRPDADWRRFLADLENDRRIRARTGTARLVDPRSEIVVLTEERRATTVKADVDARSPHQVALAAADELLRYRPLDAAHRIDAPTFVIAVAGDTVTPEQHARELAAAVRGPSALTVLEDTTHYDSYGKYGDRMAREIAEWFSTHLTGADLRSGLDDDPDDTEGGIGR